MQDKDLEKLAQMIYTHCGLRYTTKLTALKDKISKRLTELNLSCAEYCDYLNKFSLEWDYLIELLTINETYFYREEHQLNECCTVVLPAMKEEFKHRPLRIWSAACSTGEEPYTLAMLIQETGKFPKGSVEIIATDINKNVLQKAQQGWYHQGSFAFRRTPERFMRKFFYKTDNGYQIHPSIQSMVKFQHLNLLEQNNYAQIGEVDIIFCRNVLIYFDQDTIKQVIRSFHQTLSPNGYLFLGHAESITDMALGFQKVDSDKTFYYRKEPDKDEKVRRISS